MTARSLLRLIRPINLALLWAATETGSRLAGGPSWTPCGLLPSFVAAFGYARNDAVDLEADRLNRPERPVPAGDISVRFALGLSWALLALGAILAAGVALALIPVPWVLGDAGYAYLALSSIIAAPILAWFAWRPPADALEARGASRWLKVALASGIAGLWLGARAP